MARVSQSRLDSGLGFQAKVLGTKDISFRAETKDISFRAPRTYHFGTKDISFRNQGHIISGSRRNPHAAFVSALKGIILIFYYQM